MITEIEANFKVTIEKRQADLDAELTLWLTNYEATIKVKYEEAVAEWDQWLIT